MHTKHHNKPSLMCLYIPWYEDSQLQCFSNVWEDICTSLTVQQYTILLVMCGWTNNTASASGMLSGWGMLDQGCQIFATMLGPIHMEKVKASEGQSFAELFTEWSASQCALIWVEGWWSIFSRRISCWKWFWRQFSHWNHQRRDGFLQNYYRLPCWAQSRTRCPLRRHSHCLRRHSHCPLRRYSRHLHRLSRLHRILRFLLQILLLRQDRFRHHCSQHWW